MANETHLVDFVPAAVDELLVEMLTELYKLGGRQQLTQGPHEGFTTLIQDDDRVYLPGESDGVDTGS